MLADTAHDIPSTHPLILYLHGTLFGHLIQLLDLLIRQRFQIRVLINLPRRCRLSLNGRIRLRSFSWRLSGRSLVACDTETPVVIEVE
jgi:hypothetical protein